MADDPTHLAVGHVTRPHGTKGEVLVWSLTGEPDDVFVPGAEVEVAGEDGETPDPTWPALRLEAARPFRRGYLLRFFGVSSRDDAERLRERYLVLPRESLRVLDDGEYFYHQLLGLRVATADGQELGVIEEVYELEPDHMLEVVGPERSYLIPMSRRVVVDVDLNGGRMVVDPPEGLLDL